MNPTQLVDYFDRISEAPDAVPRLRQFILDLAVRGKLIEQDPNDEPASELFKRIQAEKLQLVMRGKISKRAQVPQIGDEELLFPAPSGWSWARLADISHRIHYGFTASADPSLKKVRLLRISDIQNNLVDWASVPGCEISEHEAGQYKLEQGDILIARTGGTIGKTFLVSQMPVIAVFASYLIRVQKSSEFCDRYLKLFLESPVYWKQLQDGARGTGQPNVNGQTLGKLTIAVPPLAEQHRIVAKVDELMALCDQLENAQRQRESQRDRLALASHHHLNNGAEAEACRKYAHFYLDHFSKITTTPLHIRHIRQAILNLAVRGLLVAQDLDEEPASELLGRIQAEKLRLTKDGLLRREKPVPLIADEEKPFEIPGTWGWTRIGTCSLLTEYGTSVKSEPTEDGVPVLAMGAIQDGHVDLMAKKKVPRSIDDLPQLLLKRFDLLYNRTNSAELVGKTGIFLGDDDTYTFASYLIRLRFPSNLTSPVYFNLAMNAPYFRATQIVPQLQQQCGQANVNGTKLRNMVIPLPPLTEQYRIVAKVNQLMTVCDQLEAQLTTTRTESSRLLESVLFSALQDASPGEATLSHPVQVMTPKTTPQQFAGERRVDGL